MRKGGTTCSAPGVVYRLNRCGSWMTCRGSCGSYFCISWSTSKDCNTDQHITLAMLQPHRVSKDSNFVQTQTHISELNIRINTIMHLCATRWVVFLFFVFFCFVFIKLLIKNNNEQCIFKYKYEHSWKLAVTTEVNIELTLTPFKFKHTKPAFQSKTESNSRDTRKHNTTHKWDKNASRFNPGIWSF